MRYLFLIFPLLTAVVQDDGARDLRGLIENLRSDSFDVRKKATRDLQDIGTPARSAVEGLLKDPDVEVRYRARVVLDEIDRREQIRAFREPGKRVTVSLKNATLDEVVGAVFGPLKLEYRIHDEGMDTGITTVTLNLADASFWEAVDELTKAAKVDALGRGVSSVHKGSYVLSIEPAFRWPFRWDTIGDTRIFAGPVVMGGGGSNHGNITARLVVMIPPWAVPDNIRIESVKISGQPIVEEDRWALQRVGEKLPRDPKKLTVLEVWRGKDTVSRESLKGADAVTIEGTLVVFNAPGQAGKEVRVPFSIQDLAVPPIPPLPNR